MYVDKYVNNISDILKAVVAKMLEKTFRVITTVFIETCTEINNDDEITDDSDNDILPSYLRTSRHTIMVNLINHKSIF